MHSRIKLFEEIATAKGIPKYPFHICVSNELSSRLVSKQVLLPLQSLTSVFGMGTGGPSALKSLTGVVSLDATLYVGIELSSRSVSRQVLLPLQSLTSVFGMGTGGPSALKTPTLVHLQDGYCLFAAERMRSAPGPDQESVARLNFVEQPT